MTTSGQTILELGRDDIIKAAMRKAQVLAKGQTPDSEDLLNANQALNNLVAEFRTFGMPLWARTEYTLTLVDDLDTYTFGVGQTENTPYPLRIHQAIIRDTTSLSDIDMTQMSVYDFNLLPSSSQGSPVNFTYQPKINLGTLKIWPTPDATIASTKEIILTYSRPFEYFVDDTDTPDFPEEWKNALIYGLAVLISDEYGLPLKDKTYLGQQAKEHLATALASGVEESSIYFHPAWRG